MGFVYSVLNVPERRKKGEINDLRDFLQENLLHSITMRESIDQWS
jgi:hypothetical protein